MPLSLKKIRLSRKSLFLKLSGDLVIMYATYEYLLGFDTSLYSARPSSHLCLLEKFIYLKQAMSGRAYHVVYVKWLRGLFEVPFAFD